MESKSVTIINDGKSITQEFMEQWEIEPYCRRYDNSISISFVGTVIKKECILMSFPKHYEVSYDLAENIDNMKKISRIISYNNLGQASSSGGDRVEFPIDAYLIVINYYKKYGLYSANHKYYETNNYGKINWKKTILNSNKIIKKNGIMVFPFTIEKNKNVKVFLSECMNYILGDALYYKDYLPFVLAYKKFPSSNIFDNLKIVLKKLSTLGSRYFKDEEKKLIQGIFNYIKWKASSNEKIKIITLDFENYWEKMVHFYLNSNFYMYNNDEIIWKNNQNCDFKKVSGLDVESKTIKMQKEKKNDGSKTYQIELDHFWHDNEKNICYLFDSKYFADEVKQLNYKQVFYHYYLTEKYPDSLIYNGLLIPTAQKYHTKNHIDRSDLDGIKITEHYLNLNSVLNNELSRIGDRYV